MLPKSNERSNRSLNRRVLLTGTIALGVSTIAHAQTGRDLGTLTIEDTEAPLLPPELQSYSDQASLNGPITDYQPFGTHPPTTEEQELASANTLHTDRRRTLFY
jgi:hypothetical protein